MKKIILVLVGAILLGSGCNNEQKRLDKMNDRILTKITNICQLSPEQVTKISPITENFVKVRKATKDKYSNDIDGFRKAMEVNRKNLMDTLKTVLTPDQDEKLKTFFQQQKANQGGEEGGGGGQN